MKNKIRMYKDFGLFLRNEITNIPGKKYVCVTPLLLAIYDLRAKLRKESREKKWIAAQKDVRYLKEEFSKIDYSKIILVIYLPLVHLSIYFVKGDTKIEVIPVNFWFINLENDYDPASIYFYRIGYQDGIASVIASCKYSFEYYDIIQFAEDNISYGYLMSAYVDMLECILSDIDSEYKIIYRLSPNEHYDYD